MAAEKTSPRERLLLDPSWKFHLGEIAQPTLISHANTYGAVKAGHAQGAAGVQFDDRAWREVDLPHDWVVESTAFDSRLNISHGFKDAGVAWYRKRFLLPAEDLGKRVWLEFDGVFRNCEVWFNGHALSGHRSGYTPIRFDVTDVANYGGENVLAVYVDATAFEGWWYEGAGIYRHVWLVKTAPLAVAPWGTYVTAALPDPPQGHPAEVTARTTVSNRGAEAEFTLESVARDPEGAEVARAALEARLAAGETAEFSQSLTVPEPRLWGPDTPHLYTLVTTIRQGGEVVDRYETTFGLRTLRFDAEQGFFLNGQPLKLKGTCNHQDHAGVGVAVPDAVQAWRIARLKEMGGNAYRCAHNPPAPEILDACDRLGMLVMDENRHLGATEENLAELEIMIRRDRNHPSVIMWSMCNEEPLQGTEVGGRIMKSMVELTHRLDPTRPTTAAMNGGWGGPYSEALDVPGINYSPAQYDQFHARYPEQPMTASETSSAVTDRGCYRTDPERGYLSGYDVNAPGWGNRAEEAWRPVAEREFVSGTFVWTGFDYRGEPTPYAWPCINSHFGIMDTCGFAKDNFYYYQAWWSGRTVLHLLPHWNWPGREGEEIEVWAHSNCARVELFLNGRSLGAQEMERNGHLEWRVAYEPGTLRAVGYSGEEAVAESVRETTGPPAAVELAPDRATLRADGEDVAVVTVAIRDAEGRLVPTAGNLVQFGLSGPGRIIGVGNGDPCCHEADQAPQRSAFHGLCLVLVQTRREAGEITLTAASEGLAPTQIALQAEACEPRPWAPSVSGQEAILNWRVSPLYAEEPAGDVAPADHDQNSWEAIVLHRDHQVGSPEQHGFVVYRAEATAPGYDAAQEDLLLNLGGHFTGPVKVYLNGRKAAEGTLRGQAMNVMAWGTPPGAEVAVTVVGHHAEGYGWAFGPAVWQTRPRA